jgi:hypothetical protein
MSDEVQAARAKRDREESAVVAAVAELEAAVSRDAEMKLQALQALTAEVDAADEA